MSAETVRRWVQALGWRWKRSRPAALDNDPERASKLARIPLTWQSLQVREAMLFADELNIHLLLKSGYQWMEKGRQVEVMMTGKNEKRYLAGAWDIRTGQVHQCVWARKTNALFRDLLETVETAYLASRYDRIYVVVDNYKIHKAQAVQRWLAAHPRTDLLFQPIYCPRAHPIECVFGDAHDKVTRNHRRKQIWRLVDDVRKHFRENGPWRYRLSETYFSAEVTALRRLPAQNPRAT